MYIVCVRLARLVWPIYAFGVSQSSHGKQWRGEFGFLPHHARPASLSPARVVHFENGSLYICVSLRINIEARRSMRTHVDETTGRSPRKRDLHLRSMPMVALRIRFAKKRIISMAAIEGSISASVVPLAISEAIYTLRTRQTPALGDPRSWTAVEMEHSLGWCKFKV